MTTAMIEDTLEKLTDLPTDVQSWQVELGEDATGDPAVWVWAILPDWADPETLSRLRGRIRDAVMQQMGERIRWVYVRFRSASEVVEE